jgi:hypothetical protein
MKNFPIARTFALLPATGHDSKATFKTRRPRKPLRPDDGPRKKVPEDAAYGVVTVGVAG